MGKKRKKSKGRKKKRRRQKKKSVAAPPSSPTDEASEHESQDTEPEAAGDDGDDLTVADVGSGEPPSEEADDETDDDGDADDDDGQGADGEAVHDEEGGEDEHADEEDDRDAKVDEDEAANGEEEDEEHAADASNGEEPESAVDEVIDLDGDLDDPEARADLVAAAAGLAAQTPEEPEAEGDVDEEAAEEEGVDASAAGGTEGEEGTDGNAEEAGGVAEEAAGAPVEEKAGDTVDHDDGDGPGGPKEQDEEAAAVGDELPSAGEASPDDDAPLIGADALLALSEFRNEGVATIPEELILDLGETASADERDRLLAAALAHVEMQEAIYRVPSESGTVRRWKGLIAAAIFVTALFVVGLPPGFLVPESPPPLARGERLMGIRMALLLQAEQVEAFQVREERLPNSLAEVETALPGIRFVRSSNRLYQLVAYTPDGEAVVYDSASPDPAFSEVTAPWIAPEDGS